MTLTPGQVTAIADGLNAEGWEQHRKFDVAMVNEHRRVYIHNGCWAGEHHYGEFDQVDLLDPIWRKALAVIAAVLDSDEGGAETCRLHASGYYLDAASGEMRMKGIKR